MLIMTPQWFSAKDGQITFEGKAISSFTAKRLKQELVKAGDAVEIDSRAFAIFMEAEHQLICAGHLAEYQKRLRA